MVFNYEDEEDDYGYEDDSPTSRGDPLWENLSNSDKGNLMNNVFNNDDWYEEGTPYHEGGDATPMFSMLSERVSAPVKTLKKYYRAWLKKGHRDAYERYISSMSRGVGSESSSTNYQSRPSTTSYGQQPYGQQSTSVNTPAMSQPPSMGGLPTMEPPPQDGGNEMWAMMSFLTQQQYMQMQQQQFQMQMMMDQRRLDQQKESDTRREVMARDQQFMDRQMTFMRDISKKAGDDGFFDSEMKGIFKERMVDNMFGDKDDSWRDTVKDVLGSDTLKTAVTGLGSALGTKTQVPAGYDNPNYNPYAQTPAPTQQPMVAPPPVGEYTPMETETVVAPTDGVFFTENETAVEEVPQPVPQPPAPEIQQFSEDEYKNILFSAFTQAMGPAAEDEKVVQALQQQVEVAVQTTLIEMPEALPQMKLQAMNEKLMVIRNLRDIGMGLMELREKTPPGSEPSGILLAAIVGELRKNPEFYGIFATNTYDELMAKIEPFKETGAVSQDYTYLLQPEVQEICRAMLNSVASDAAANGFPNTNPNLG